MYEEVNTVAQKLKYKALSQRLSMNVVTHPRVTTFTNCELLKPSEHTTDMFYTIVMLVIYVYNMFLLC